MPIVPTLCKLLLKYFVQFFNTMLYVFKFGYILTYYVFHDRVTLFFADNFSMECQIIVKFLHNFF